MLRIQSTRKYKSYHVAEILRKNNAVAVLNVKKIIIWKNIHFKNWCSNKTGLNQKEATPEDPLHCKILTMLWFPLILKGDMNGTSEYPLRLWKYMILAIIIKMYF